MKTLEDEILIAYTSALNASKMQISGIRIRHFELVSIIDSNGSVRCCDIAKIYGCSLTASYNRLRRCALTGLIYKEAKRYYVSDSGKRMCNVLRDNMKDKIAVIKARMLAEIRKQL